MAKNTISKYFKSFKDLTDREFTNLTTLFFILMFILGFSYPAYSASMSQIYIAEIIQTQVSFDADISFGDRRYLYLEDYPDITQMAIVEFLNNPHDSMGPLFDCEDIARAAQIRTILVFCKLLPDRIPNKLCHGVPIGTVIFGNFQMKHVVNIIIYNGIAIMYDVGWERIWTSEDIEDSGFWVMQIAF